MMPTRHALAYYEHQRWESIENARSGERDASLSFMHLKTRIGEFILPQTRPGALVPFWAKRLGDSPKLRQLLGGVSLNVSSKMGEMEAQVIG